MFRRWFCALLALLILPGAALAMDRAELRARWAEVESMQSDASPYAVLPDVQSFQAGSLTNAAQANALACLNLIRALAGLESVSINPLYALRAQNAALLLAANDLLTHEPERPEGMDAELYESGRAGASQGNIARFNWMKPEILTEAVTYFVRDDGDSNLAALGHRRWLLNPEMAETGFGLANAESGASYVTMYAVDGGRADVEWSSVAWPSAGCFPVELMRRELAWSVSLNDALYDLDASAPQAILREERSGAEFFFNFESGEGDGYCALNREARGSGSCLIFRPNLALAGIEEYEQNQVWRVEISGLVGADGETESLNYACEMVSLYPQDVAAVELDILGAELAVGERLQLSASVIPAYADDLSLSWASSDESVACVGADGLVTALAPGECSISASSANGRSDACALRVRGE